MVRGMDKSPHLYGGELTEIELDILTQMWLEKTGRGQILKTSLKTYEMVIFPSRKQQ